MFEKAEAVAFHPVMEGIEMKTTAYGEKTLMTLFRLKAGATLPDHAHHHEQIGYLVSGRIRLTIGGQSHEAAGGDCWCIPGNTQHGALCLEDALAVEVFVPVREDYLP